MIRGAAPSLACALALSVGCAQALDQPAGPPVETDDATSDAATSTGAVNETTGASGGGGGGGASASSTSGSASSTTAATTTAASTSGAGGGGGAGGGVNIVDCNGCAPSPVADCGSDVVVIGHYEGGDRTVCVEWGDGTPFKLVLVSYETTNWNVIGDVNRIQAVQVYSYQAMGLFSSSGNLFVDFQFGGDMPADPYDYGATLGECSAHAGYAGAVFGVPETEVCQPELGLPDACSHPSFSCLAIDP